MRCGSYHRFALSLRDVEELMLARGVVRFPPFRGHLDQLGVARQQRMH